MVDRIMAASCIQLCARLGRAGFANIVRIERCLRSVELCHGILTAPILCIAFCILPITSSSVCAVCAVHDKPETAWSASDAPSLESAIGAFLATRRWLDAANVPKLDDPSSAITLEGTTMVVVLLRTSQGRLVGIGEDAQSDPLMLRRAVGRAFTKALGHASIASVRASLGDDVGKALSIEIELCGASTPLLGRTMQDCAMRVCPGIDGIALRRGATTYRLSPARLLAIDSAERPEGAIRLLLSDAGLPSEDLPQLHARDSVSLNSFRSTRVAQPNPTALPVAVTRAGRLISLHECTRSEQGLFLHALVTRLAHDVVSLPQGDIAIVTGDYDAIAATHEPALAKAREQALVAFALANAAASTQLPDALRDSTRARATLALHAVLHAPEPTTPTIEAFALLALHALEPLQDPTLVAARATIIARLIDPARGSKEPDSLALVAAALLRAGCAEGNAILTQAWTLDENTQARNLAWLAMAESLLPTTTHTNELQALASMLTSRQLVDTSNGAPEDLLGGFDLVSRSGAQAGGRLSSVDSQSTRVTFALALLLADPRFVEEVHLGERARTQALALRFLRQLALDAPLTDLMRDGADASDRIRGSLGTYRAPLAAQAMAVLAVTESLRALDARSAMLNSEQSKNTPK